MIKDNNSKKHHYTPIAYIKNFTNNEGKVYVFDKEIYKKTNKIVITQKYPSQICYIKNDNTIFHDKDRNRISDFPEQCYTQFCDTPMSIYLKKLKEYNNQWPLTTEETHEFYLILLLQYYRSPMNREDLYNLRKMKGMDHFYTFKNLDISTKYKYLKILEESEMFNKTELISLPLFFYKYYFLRDKASKILLDDLNLHKMDFSKLPDEEIRLLTSDNPIICKNLYKNTGLINHYFIPISENIILYRWPNFYQSFQAVNSLIINRAKRYIFSNKKVWLEKSINQHYETIKNLNISKTKVDEMMIYLIENGLKTSHHPTSR